MQLVEGHCVRFHLLSTVIWPNRSANWVGGPVRWPVMINERRTLAAGYAGTLIVTTFTPALRESGQLACTVQVLSRDT